MERLISFQTIYPSEASRVWNKVLPTLRQQRLHLQILCLCLQGQGLFLHLQFALGRSGKEVVHLMIPVLGKGYWLFVEYNWYSSVDLFGLRQQHQTSRSPDTIMSMTNEYREKSHGKPHHFILCWHRKFVHMQGIFMLTTCQLPSPTSEGVKPPCIRKCNFKIGAVDQDNQLLHPYDTIRRSLKWFQKLCVRFLQITIWNTHIVYQKAGNTMAYEGFHSCSDL